jgi:hypothetical protein
VVFAALALIAASTGAAPASFFDIYASGDTYGDQNIPSTSQDNKGLWCAKNWGGANGEKDDYLWYQFGTVAVTSATFKVYQCGVIWPGVPGRINSNGTVKWLAQTNSLAGPDTGNYTEANTTWNHRPAAGGWLPNPLGTFAVHENIQEWRSFDITSFYNSHLGQYIIFTNWIDGSDFQGGCMFEDSENTIGTGNRPRITIDGSVPEPSSLLALATGLFGLAGVAIRKRR